MLWADLSKDAKSILEWVEHVWTGKRQTLVIERGTRWHQPVKYAGDVNVDVTDGLFEEIKSWLPFSNDTVHSINGDVITVTLKDGIRLH